MNSSFLKNYRSLAVSIFLSTLLLFADVPLWCSALSILFWLWSLFCHQFSFKTPSRTVTGILSFFALVVILVEFKTVMGKEPAASFIIILSGLKVLEFSRDEEKDFLVLLGFFLISAKFLFSYDLSYLIVAIPVYLTLTLNLFPAIWLKTRRATSLKYLSKVVLLAVPMATLMFVLFPRITKTLLEMPSNYRGGSYSGFSDSVSPGSISKLALSNELVLRLEPVSKDFTLHDLYISGLTLEKNNQMNWIYSRVGDVFIKSEAPLDIDYKLIIEPHYKNNIFTVKNTDRMSSEGQTIYIDNNYNFKFGSLLEKKAFVHASIASVKIQMTDELREKNLEQPDLNFLTAEQLTQLNQLNSNLKNGRQRPEDINQAILDYFAKNRFEYTLNPGAQPNLNLHDFLFKYRKGYCEHFASAHALLLRLNKVPARVVVGYHGGEFNPMGRFWTIRQKDAHAWVEFLNSNNKWTLTDPVSVIAPQRLELGSELYSSVVNDLLTVDEIRSRVNNTGIFARLSMWFDNVNYRWNSFLLEYDFDKQKDILRSLNLNLGTALIIVLLLFFLVSLGINLFQRRGIKKKFSELGFNEINNWATRFDLQKLDTEGPLTWQNRLFTQLPAKYQTFHGDLKKAFDLWIQLSYQGTLSDADSKRSFTELKRTIKKVR